MCGYKNYMFYIRFAIRKENVHGNDTAAGSGILGSVQHFKPTMYKKILCHKQELRIVK